MNDPKQRLQLDSEPDPQVPEWRTCQIKGLPEQTRLDWFSKRGCKLEINGDSVLIEKAPTNGSLHRRLDERELDIMMRKMRDTWPEDLIFMFSSK